MRYPWYVQFRGEVWDIVLYRTREIWADPRYGEREWAEPEGWYVCDHEHQSVDGPYDTEAQAVAAMVTSFGTPPANALVKSFGKSFSVPPTLEDERKFYEETPYGIRVFAISEYGVYVDLRTPRWSITVEGKRWAGTLQYNTHTGTDASLHGLQPDEYLTICPPAPQHIRDAVSAALAPICMRLWDEHQDIVERMLRWRWEEELVEERARLAAAESQVESASARIRSLKRLLNG